MKKTLLTLAAALAVSTTAMAGDFDDTKTTVEVKGQTFGVALSSEDTQRTLAVSVYSDIANFRVEQFDAGSTADYRYTIGKTFTKEVGSVGLYLVPELHYTHGDSYAKDELRVSPYVGAALNTGSAVTPFVEAGYDWKSSKGSFDDLSKADSYAKVGVAYAINSTVSLVGTINTKMDTEFNKTSRNAEVKFVSRF